MLPRREFITATTAALAAASTAAAQTSPPKRIKIGQIGVGHAHASKLGVYRTSPDYEVVGIVEPDPLLREKAKSTDPFKDLPWMTQEQLLNLPGLEAVLVETQVRDLLNTAEACVMAGKHIHLDKPAGESLSQFRRILQAAQRQKLLVQMGYMYRYNPGVVLLREFVDRGWLGDIFEVHTVMSKVVASADRVRFAEYRGGILFELGCHVLDTVIKLLGKPAGVTAFAKHTSRIDDKLQDNMLAVLNYDRAIATVKSTALEVDGFEGRRLTVCGTEGTFHIQPLDNPKGRVALTQPREASRSLPSNRDAGWKKGYQDVSLPKYTRYVDDAADMAKILRGEKPSDFSYEHDLVVQETLLAACGL